MSDEKKKVEAPAPAEKVVKKLPVLEHEQNSSAAPYIKAAARVIGRLDDGSVLSAEEFEKYIVAARGLSVS